MPAQTAIERFRVKVDYGVPVPHDRPDLGRCDLWTGSTVKGYGTFWYQGDRWYAHRWLWVETYGPLPAGMIPDHLCHSYQWCQGGQGCPHRPCVNLDHLQPATPQANLVRGCGPPGVNSRKDVCVRNHPLAGANVYRHPRRGTRHCRRCQAGTYGRRGRAAAGQLILPL